MKKRQLVKLSKKDKDRLWGEIGPLSQVNLTIKTRIFDDVVYRLLLEIRVLINPYTFEMVQKYKQDFSEDIMAQTLLKNATYIKEDDGYVSYTYSKQYEPGLIEEALIYREETKKTLIRMHTFVMQHLDVRVN